jgi:hypothetical protein
LKLGSVLSLRMAMRFNSFNFRRNPDQVAPLVEVPVDAERCFAPRHLWDDDLRPTLVQGGDDPVGVERFVGDQAAEFDGFDKRGNPDCVVALLPSTDEFGSRAV